MKLSMIGVILFVFLTITALNVFGQDEQMHVLISTNNQILEYSRAGFLIKSISVPYTDFNRPSEVARDLAVDQFGRVFLYNGTFAPVLSIYSSNWQHRSFEGWSTANNVSYGGIGVFNQYVYVTDMSTYKAEAKGLVRFDISGESPAKRFAADTDFIDLAITRTGVIYGLTERERSIQIYNPQTLQVRSKIRLPKADFRAITINQANEIFGVTYDGELFHLSKTGRILSYRKISLTKLSDINISEDGTLLVIGSQNDAYAIIDTQFRLLHIINIGVSAPFVTFSTHNLSDLQ